MSGLRGPAHAKPPQRRPPGDHLPGLLRPWKVTSAVVSARKAAAALPTADEWPSRKRSAALLGWCAETPSASRLIKCQGVSWRRERGRERWREGRRSGGETRRTGRRQGRTLSEMSHNVAKLELYLFISLFLSSHFFFLIILKHFFNCLFVLRSRYRKKHVKPS